MAIVLSHAQTPKIDSLKNELIRNSESDRFDILWGLAYELFDVDNFQAVEYAKEAHINALASGDSLNIVKSGRIEGQLLRRVGKVDESLQILNYVLPISERLNFEKELKIILNALAVSHGFKSEHDKALEYHFRSLILREKEGNEKEIVTSLNNIGVVYYKLRNHNLALEYFFEALKIKEELNEKVSRFEFANIGLCYNKLFDFNNSRKFFSKAIESCSPNCDDEMIKEVYFGLGYSFFLEKNYSEAEKYYKKSLAISCLLKNQRFQLQDLVHLIEIAVIKNDLVVASNYFERVELLPDKDQFNEYLVDVFKLRAKYYTLKKDYIKATLFYEKYLNIVDKTNGLNNNLLKIQTQYAERENLARLELQAKTVALQQEALYKHKLLNSAIGLISILSFVLVWLLFKGNIQKQRINEELNCRVRERTRELERNSDALKLANDEKALILKKVLSELGSSLATMKGLSFLASQDLPEEQANYIRQATITTERLAYSINKYVIPHPSESTK